jgi:NAD(P)-dependent dehydrogenase (short-subunit alcohol dehydrogenase family)
MDKDMTQNKTILITGCSSGIGYDAAHTLNKRGWRVFATCRKEVDCERLRSEGLESFILDYADPASVTAGLAETLSRTDGSLDALFNNGAYAIPAMSQDYSRDALKDIFETNFFGQFDLIHQVLPTMMEQGHGRIINNSSVLGLVAMRGRGAYVATKFAMEGLSDTLRLELHDQGIKMILIEPGPITTKIRQNAQHHFEKWIDWKGSRARKIYEHAFIPRLYDESGKLDRGELPASAVTTKLIHALESSNPKPRYYVTTPTYISGFLKRVLSTRLLDKIVRKF